MVRDMHRHHRPPADRGRTATERGAVPGLDGAGSFQRARVRTAVAPAGEPGLGELWGDTLDQLADYNILHDPQLEAKGASPYIMRAFAGEAVTISALEYDPEDTLPDRTRHENSRRWVAASPTPQGPAGRIRGSGADPPEHHRPETGRGGELRRPRRRRRRPTGPRTSSWPTSATRSARP